MTTDRTIRRKRWLQGGALGLVVVAAATLIGYRAPAADPPKNAQWIPVQAAPLVHQIGLVGKIEPQKTITLTAPFDGNVRAVLVEQGQRVESGQALVQMDPALLEIQLRDALSAQLKARRAVQELQDWNNSQQVARSRRSLRAVEMSVSNNERKLRESQTLLQRGIIARSELDDLQQQLQTQRLDLAAAQGDLQQALDQGKGEYRQIADMELTNATVKYEALRTLLEGKNVLAPFAGIVVPAPGASSPQGTTTNSSGPVQNGSRVTQGQVLFGLANIEQLKIVSKVSELDINQLHQGQRVEILGDGFDGVRLDGAVDIVSSLALPSDSPGGSAQFPVTLSVPKLEPGAVATGPAGHERPPDHHHLSQRSGNRAPPCGLQHIDNGLVVEYREAVDQPIRRVTVSAGQATPEGVEVFGLQPGFVRLLE